MHIQKLWFSIVLLTVAVACQPVIPVSITPVDENDISIVVTVYPVETTTPFLTEHPEATPFFEPTTDAIISQVKNDLAQKTGISLDKINVLEVEAVEWPDGSLGCGKPGTEYLQVVTPGFHILLEAGGQMFSYHTNTSSQIILCSEQPPSGINPTP